MMKYVGKKKYNGVALKTRSDIDVGHELVQHVIEWSHYEEAEVIQLCLHGPQRETCNRWTK